MARREPKPRVALTKHFKERYVERVGNASSANQRAWIQISLMGGRPRRQRDGKYVVKLRGTSYDVVLAREDDIWVAVTVQ